MVSNDTFKTKRDKAINLYQTRYNSTLEDYKKYIILVGTNKALSILTIFSYRGAKPLHNYSFLNKQELENYLVKFKSNIDLAEHKQNEIFQACNSTKELYQVGSILYSSWGYEQTNIDFYLIIERKNDFVTLVQIAKDRSYDADDKGTCIANPSNIIGEPFRKKISKYATIKLSSYSSCSLWDGKPLYWSSYA